MYTFNSSEVSYWIGKSYFSAVPKYVMFEKFLSNNDEPLYKKCKSVKGKTLTKPLKSMIDNSARQQIGKKSEKNIIDHLAKTVTIKETRIRKNKIYEVDGININIRAEVDLITEDGKYYEIKKRINSLSNGIRPYEKTQLVLYCDIFDIDEIILFEYLDEDNYQEVIFKRESPEEVLTMLRKFIDRFLKLKESNKLDNYNGLSWKKKDEIIKDLFKIIPPEDKFLNSLII